MSDAKR